MKTKLYFFILLFCATTTIKAQTTLISENFDDVAAIIAPTTALLSENFDDISTLSASGWTTLNSSIPAGTTGWFQGFGTSIPSQSGALNSSIQANSQNVSGDNTISNWLITPPVSLENGDKIKFWTRTQSGTIYPDRLQVRLTIDGAAPINPSSPTSVGSYSLLLEDINPNLTVGGYPEDYTEYTLTIQGFLGPADCRVALRYFVTNGGSGANSNMISIDTFSITRAVPPSWTTLNTSLPIGTTGWFQGGSVIPSQAGATSSSIQANYQNVSGANTISNWLIAPSQLLQNGDLIKFWTRKAEPSIYPDRLEVRLSTAGASTLQPSDPLNIGTYFTLLTTINPTLTVDGYPQVYTEYSLPVSGLLAPSNCLVAFRYYVTNGGSGANSSLISIDTFSIIRPALANENFDLQSKIALTPNPVIDSFQLNLNNELDASNIKVEIYDLNGRMIKNFQKQSMYSIVDLESGVYLVKVSDVNFAETKRILKN